MYEGFDVFSFIVLAFALDIGLFLGVSSFFVYQSKLRSTYPRNGIRIIVS